MDAKNRQYRKYILLSIFMLFIFSNFTFGQGRFSDEREIPEIAVTNYIAGIQSDNYGLKMSCIYFAGKYLLNDANDCLIEEFKKADDATIAVIIAWSVYRIGDSESIANLNELAENHYSNEVKSLCQTLCDLKSYEEQIYKVK